MQNLQLIQRFKKQTVEHSPLREKLNFWMDIIVEATQGTTNRLRFPVQLLTVIYSEMFDDSFRVKRFGQSFSLCIAGVDSGADKSLPALLCVH